jgi:protein-S-isoprenylcysteine O-methyltransferase Ste14
VATLAAVAPVAYLVGLLILQLATDAELWSWPRDGWELALSGCAIGYLLLLLRTYWHKPPPIAARSDARAVIASVLGMDALGISAALPVTQPDALPLAVGLSLTGTLLAIWAVLHLGSNFSFLPQARELVTSGPYTYVRHPLYAAGLLITSAEILSRFSVTVVVLNVLFVAAQVWRLRIEEELLAATFPGYEEYRRRTSALIPPIW